MKDSRPISPILFMKSLDYFITRVITLCFGHTDTICSIEQFWTFIDFSFNFFFHRSEVIGKIEQDHDAVFVRRSPALKSMLRSPVGHSSVDNIIVDILTLGILWNISLMNVHCTVTCDFYNPLIYRWETNDPEDLGILKNVEMTREL